MWNFQWWSFVFFRSGISKVTNKPRNFLFFFSKKYVLNHPCLDFFGILYCSLLDILAASYLASFHIWTGWNWFHFLILMGKSAHILIGCIIFLPLFLDIDVIKMCMSTVSFLAQLWAGSRLRNSLPVMVAFFDL